MKNYATRTAVDVRRSTLNSAGVAVYYRMYLRTHADFAERQNETKTKRIHYSRRYRGGTGTNNFRCCQTL